MPGRSRGEGEHFGEQAFDGEIVNGAGTRYFAEELHSVPEKLPADVCRARDTLETPELTPALDIEEPHQGGCLYSRRAARVFVSVRPQPSRGWKVDFRRRVDETYVDLDPSFGSGFVAGGKHAASGCK